MSEREIKALDAEALARKEEALRRMNASLAECRIWRGRRGHRRAARDEAILAAPNLSGAAAQPLSKGAVARHGRARRFAAAPGAAGRRAAAPRMGETRRRSARPDEAPPVYGVAAARPTSPGSAATRGDAGRLQAPEDAERLRQAEHKSFEVRPRGRPQAHCFFTRSSPRRKRRTEHLGASLKDVQRDRDRCRDKGQTDAAAEKRPRRLVLPRRRSLST